MKVNIECRVRVRERGAAGVGGRDLATAKQGRGEVD